ncbi:hypothetical protein CSUI_004415 [Cystoisospora suis]|uniref:Transmembrane protein n=1 Tax=Cystoisospora suis TaxID=483139 RepID=A0A2C6KYV4_9APIC|nr:hypothetical protein CSUI_004415 [Cystoisospora suis]
MTPGSISRETTVYIIGISFSAPFLPHWERKKREEDLNRIVKSICLPVRFLRKKKNEEEERESLSPYFLFCASPAMFLFLSFMKNE